MARKKTITRDQILTAAYEVVANNGFSKFTARNIATQMKCSTQPIYLEFANMDDLKQEVVKAIFTHLSEDIFTREVTGNRLIDFGLNYIDFATKEKKLYRALYLEDSGNGSMMQETSFYWFKKLAIDQSEYANLSESEIKSIYIGFWIMATGMASLMSAGILEFVQEDVIKALQETLTIVIDRKETIDIKLAASK
jgi:AcrR family transcriptional regulator